MIARATLVRLALVSAALGGLTGCDTVGGAVSSAGSSVGGFFSHSDPNAARVNLGVTPNPRRAVVQPTANPTDRLKVLPVAAQDINCPEVTVADGGAALRVGGPENSSVRYQFNIGDTARQCDPAGTGQATVKIGVAGEVVMGPAGQAGHVQRAAEDHGDAAHRQHIGLFPDLSGRGDDGRGEGWPVSYCDRSGQSANADSSTCGPLFDHRRF